MEQKRDMRREHTKVGTRNEWLYSAISDKISVGCEKRAGPAVSENREQSVIEILHAECRVHAKAAILTAVGIVKDDEKHSECRNVKYFR